MSVNIECPCRSCYRVLASGSFPVLKAISEGNLLVPSQGLVAVSYSFITHPSFQSEIVFQLLNPCTTCTEQHRIARAFLAFAFLMIATLMACFRNTHEYGTAPHMLPLRLSQDLAPFVMAKVDTSGDETTTNCISHAACSWASKGAFPKALLRFWSHHKRTVPRAWR